MPRAKIKKHILDYTMISVGVVLMSIGITVFFARYSLVTGGFTGLSIVIRELTGRFGKPIPIWLTNIVLNTPLFILAVRARGFEFLAKTLYATALLSLAMYLAGLLPPIDIDLTLAAVFGGVLQGVGLGLVFRCMASTGGTDLIANIVNKYYPHLPLQKILFAVDSAIIALGFFIFGPLLAMYAVIAVYIVTKVIDRMLEGLNFAKAAFIISDRADEVAQVLMSRLQRGVTGLSGTGMYTKGSKNVILCVVSSKEIITVKEIVRELDPGAFVMVADVREVLGEGFKEIA